MEGSVSKSTNFEDSWYTSDGKVPKVFWNQKVSNTRLEEFQTLIENKFNIKFDSYWEFHKWTIENFEKFWEEMWHYSGIIASKPYDKVFVKTGPGFLDNDWFTGALFNVAENVLRIRDNSVALIYLDELGNEETVTYMEMFQEVKLYAAAFRRNGLKKGDRVAGHISNRKEAIFAMLATNSIGAIWGGQNILYGAKSASDSYKMMEPKFMITIDVHYDDGITYPILERLPFIVNNTPSLEKVILIVTNEETYEKDLSTIKNCVFLDDFLQAGRNPDGSLPDIEFEQLPANHPIYIGFTSGTTGMPKALVLSAGSLVARMRDFTIHLNLKKGDVVASHFAVGSSLWYFFSQSLALGVKSLLYCCNPLYKHNGKNFWDIMAKYNVKFTVLAVKVVDLMEKAQVFPSPDSNMDCLDFIAIGCSPVKKENIEYLNSVTENAFICNMFGTSEVVGLFSGHNLNMPVYASEIQVQALGVDIQCFDAEGKSVIGKRGELVVCTPAPNFPLYLWKDVNNTQLADNYLKKYPGVWCQNDECWINPKTRGLIVIGRSDDTLNQYGVRFSSSDVYFAIHALEELQDYICVSQQKYNGDCRSVLFVKLQSGYKLTPDVITKIKKAVIDKTRNLCVPEVICEVADIPYNWNHKKMESVVKSIVKSNKIPEVMNIQNPESLKHFLNIPEIVNYNKQ